MKILALSLFISFETYGTAFLKRMLSSNKKEFKTSKKESKSGTFGTVFFGTYGKIDAVKKIIHQSSYTTREKINDLQAEISILNQMGHLLEDNVTYIGSNKIGEGSHIIIKYLGETLEDRLKEKGFAKRSHIEVSGIYLCIANRIKELHQLGFIHYDIKPENVTYTEPSIEQSDSPQKILSKYLNSCHLIDFGLSMTTKDPYDDIRGSPQYSPPDENFDSVCNKDTTLKDVYSFYTMIAETLATKNSSVSSMGYSQDDILAITSSILDNNPLLELIKEHIRGFFSKKSLKLEVSSIENLFLKEIQKQ